MKSKMQPREGWWFSDDTGFLPHGDGRPIVIGQRLAVKGKLVICQNALHGSFDPFDALAYAPGPILHRVLFSGARIEESDKVGSRSRTVLATRNAEDMLLSFARKQALTCINNWDAPTVVKKYLETGTPTLRSAAHSAAENAAWSAAENATENAAWSAARSAAESAAESAAHSAARSAAHSAARSAARSATENAAWSAAENAAWSAAWGAAHSAAWSAARQMFNEMVEELFNGL